MANKPHTSRAKATPAYAKPNTSGKPPRKPSRSSPPPAGGRRPSATMLLVVGVIALLAVAAAVTAVVVSNRSSADEPSTAGLEQTQPVTVTGTALVTLPEHGTDPAIGVTAPTLAGLSFDGTPVAVGGTKDDATLVVFAAHWCPHCRREIPELATWDPPAGVDVVAVATQTSSGEPNYPPSSWFTKAGWPYPVMADSPTYQAATAYGMDSWPGFVLLDKDGVVRWRGSGEIDLDDLTQTIDTALGLTTSTSTSSTVAPAASTPATG